jgi:L-aspartate oxidase
MLQIHPAAELAPRDVVARGIARQMALQQGLPVLLDATSMSADFLAKRFPSIDAATRARNLDWSRNTIPVNPAAHYWMGGVRTDTSIPGLYAVGEVACTGVHGANRLASNSLLESLTFAWRCAHLLLENNPAPQLSHLDGAPTALDPSPAAGTKPITRSELQTLLWTRAAIERDATNLQSALRTLNNSHVAGVSIHDLETSNLLSLARVLVTAALAREESRGAHFRTDFRKPSAAFEHSLIYAQTTCLQEIVTTETAISCQ